MPDRFPSQEVIALTGVTARQLQWWDERGVVKPAREGHRRLYSMQNVMEMAVICELRRKGFSLQGVRKVMRFLQREFGKGLGEIVGRNSDVHLLTDGTHLYLETSARQIVDILPPAFPADRLLLCEVFTPGGNWSSYPPHKHDTDDPPREVDLEEIYYFRYADPNGYGFHRVYNKRRDETVRVADGDVVAVRDGYHPFVTAFGYDAYYLNVLAGTRRSMAASDDPLYAHLRRGWPPPDPRLPLVPKP